MNAHTLQKPIERPNQEPITSVTLRKPDVGALRGLKLTDLLQMDVKAIERLLPKISSPPLLPGDVAQLDPSDFIALAGQVIGFFVTAEQAAQLESDRLN